MSFKLKKLVVFLKIFTCLLLSRPFNILISCEYSILVKVEFGVVVKLFVERGKLENLVKNPRSKVRTNNKLNPHVALGQNGTWTILVGGECSHHYTTTPHNRNAQK